MMPPSPAPRRGRTWRPSRRPLAGPRRPIIAAGRVRPKVPPPGGSKPPETPPRPPSARLPEQDRAILLALMRYVPDLLRWARRCGVPAGDAPDVAQEVLLRAWHRWETSERAPEHRAGWLFTITVRVASAFHRRDRRAPLDLRDPAEMEHAPDASPLPDEPSEQRAGVASVEELRAGTTPERWRVFLAYEVEGVAATAIAKREGIPLGTAYNRLRLARRDVRAVVQRHRAKLAHAATSAAIRRGKR